MKDCRVGGADNGLWGREAAAAERRVWVSTKGEFLSRAPIASERRNAPFLFRSRTVPSAASILISLPAPTPSPALSPILDLPAFSRSLFSTAFAIISSKNASCFAPAPVPSESSLKSCGLPVGAPNGGFKNRLDGGRRPRVQYS